MKPTVKCPECYSTELYKNGKDKKGNQKYLCKKCRRQFKLKSIKKLNNPKWPACCKDTFSGHRFSINTIINAINLYYSLNATTRAISTYLLDYMNIKVSHVTISKWIKKFDKYFKSISDELTKNLYLGYADETVVKINGQWY